MKEGEESGSEHSNNMESSQVPYYLPSFGIAGDPARIKSTSSDSDATPPLKIDEKEKNYRSDETD